MIKKILFFIILLIVPTVVSASVNLDKLEEVEQAIRDKHENYKKQLQDIESKMAQDIQAADAISGEKEKNKKRKEVFLTANEQKRNLRAVFNEEVIELQDQWQDLRNGGDGNLERIRSEKKKAQASRSLLPPDYKEKSKLLNKKLKEAAQQSTPGSPPPPIDKPAPVVENEKSDDTIKPLNGESPEKQKETKEKYDPYKHPTDLKRALWGLQH